MKTKEELKALKEEAETLNIKLAELTDEEMDLVVGGGSHEIAETLIDGLIDDKGHPVYALTTMNEPSKDPKSAQRSENCANFMTD